MARLREHHRHDLVPDAYAGRNAVAHFVDDASGVHSRYVGRWIGLLLLGAKAVAHEQVGRIDRGGMNANADLATSGMNLRHVDHLEHLRPAVLHNSDRTHSSVSSTRSTSSYSFAA